MLFLSKFNGICTYLLLLVLIHFCMFNCCKLLFYYYSYYYYCHGYYYYYYYYCFYVYHFYLLLFLLLLYKYSGKLCHRLMLVLLKIFCFFLSSSFFFLAFFYHSVNYRWMDIYKYLFWSRLWSNKYYNWWIFQISDPLIKVIPPYRHREQSSSCSSTTSGGGQQFSPHFSTAFNGNLSNSDGFINRVIFSCYFCLSWWYSNCFSFASKISVYIMEYPLF